MIKSKETFNKVNSVSNKNICYIAIKGLENEQNLVGEFSFLRKTFFNNNGKTVKVVSDEDFIGYKAQTKGKISKGSCMFKKVAEKVNVELITKDNKNYILTRLDINGNLCGKIYFDKSNAWTKTEYFNINDSTTSSHMLKPSTTHNEIEYYEYNKHKKQYEIINLVAFDFEESKKDLLLSKLDEKEHCVFVEFENESKIYLEKEVIDRLNGIENESELKVEFEVIEDELELEKEQVTEQELEKLDELEELEEIVEEVEEIEPKEIAEFVAFREVEENGVTMNYTGKMLSGNAQGRGRTENSDGITIFDGNYKDGLKEGFGCYYGASGTLKFAGFYQDDIKNGSGVSFREKDMAVHVANWTNGKPSDMVTLFDKDGNLKFSGKVVEEHKVGAGVEYNKEKDCFIVYKHKGDGSNPKEATIFDKDGNLVYSGGYINGKREGEGVEYTTNGTVAYVGKFKDDNYEQGMLYKQIN